MGLEIGFSLGAMIVFFAIVHGLSRYRRPDPVNDPETDAVAREVYAHRDR